MYEIVIGRSEQDRQRFGLKGTVLLGKHYVKMGQTTSLSNNIYMDVATSHVMFVCGKRGTGKSYTLAAIAEGMIDLPHEIAQNLSIVMLDTMGIYWTMKYPNKQDTDLLREWGIEGKSLNIDIYTPIGYYNKYKEQGIPTDFPFSIRPSELDAGDWCMTFEISRHERIGILVERTVNHLRKEMENYAIEDMVSFIKSDPESDKDTKQAAINLFESVEDWGLFDLKGTPIKELLTPGKVTVLDVSCYATMSGGWAIKSLVIGLIAEKLFIERMNARKYEEYQMIQEKVHVSETRKKQEMPLVWLIIDEAHEFLPNQGKTLASDPLITILREGRQPGISLILASQQPGKIHTDVMTQADTVLSHRITAKIDVDALGMLMQSYMREGLVAQLDNLPRSKGTAIIFDDTNERLYPMRVRPRMSWHGGSSPVAMKEMEEEEEEG